MLASLTHHRIAPEALFFRHLVHAWTMNKAAKPDDSHFPGLIEAVAKRRDRDAFVALFDYYAPRIKGFLMRSGLAAGHADDLAQDALLAVWRKAGQFDRNRASASAWIFTIARNLRIDSLRRDRRAAAHVFDDTDLPEAPAQPSEEFEAAERVARVRAALLHLSKEQIRVVELSFFEGKAHAEIADQLSLPLGTVKSRVRLAMTRLRELLGDLS